MYRTFHVHRPQILNLVVLNHLSFVIFVTITKVDNYEPPTPSLLRSSLYLSVVSQTCPFYNILHPCSSRSTYFFFFPPHNPLISVDEINHSNLSTHVMHISIFSSSCLLRNMQPLLIASKF